MFDNYPEDLLRRMAERHHRATHGFHHSPDFTNPEKTEMSSRYHPHTIGIFAVVGIVAAILLWVLFPWKTVVVRPAHDGVIVEKPYFFGAGGVRRDEILSPGRWWMWKSNEVIEVVAVPYKQEVRIDDFATKDNYLVDFDSTVSLRIKDSAGIIADWRITFWSESLKAEYSSIVRREVSKYTLYELMSDTVKLAKLDNDITTKMREYLVSIKIPVVVENVSLGRAKPTAEVQAQINETARQTEASQTNVKKAAAEIERKTAEEKRADADKAYASKMNINPEQFTALRIAEMQTQACMKATNCVIGLDRVTPAGK